MSATEKKKVYIVSETHWDREWYQSFQQFRMRLVKLTDKLLHVLENVPEYKKYVFDGQTVVLEDYLEIKPQNKERFIKHIKSGRLHVGPWYVLPDEFLVSGEALVRNLLIGKQIAESFGRCMSTGYIPDPFGHIGQLPAILSGFGLNGIIFMRGLGEETGSDKTELYWVGLDGTKALVINQRNSYCNASSLGLDSLWAETTPDLEKAYLKIKQEIDSLEPYGQTPYILLNNGCDHVVPMPELPEVIAYAQERLPDYELIHSTYEDFVSAVQGSAGDFPVINGELHSGKYHPLLSGVYSARMWIKQWNMKDQQLLTRWMEPTSAFASFLGIKPEREFMRFAWKELLKNHPHDSICGCSIDEVHRDMVPRFAAAEQIANTIVDENLKAILSKIDTMPDWEGEAKALTVFNPHGWSLSAPAVFTGKLPLEHAQLPKNIVVKDETGKRISCQMTNQALSLAEEPIPINQKKWTFDLLIDAKDVPGFGYKTYYYEWGDPGKHMSMLVATPNLLENAFLRVDVKPNGTLDITDKRCGVTYPNCLLIEDTEDAGDEYDWSNIANSMTVSNHGVSARLSLIESGPVRASVKIEYDLVLPVSLSSDRLSRSSDLAICSMTHIVSLSSDGVQVDIKTIFDNHAKDHRLRVVASAPIATSKHWSETNFGVIERSNRPPKGTGWCQMPQATHASQTWVAADDGQYGMAVLNCGLPEYEVRESSETTDILLTLLRCVGWLSHHYFPTRPYNAGPHLEAPEAQCIGKYEFAYSFMPYVGSWKQAKVWKNAHLLNAPFKVVQDDLHDGDLPKAMSVFKVDNDDIVISSIKLSELGDDIIVRLYNTAAEPVTASLTTSLNVRSVKAVNMAELPLSENELPAGVSNIQVSGHTTTLTLNPNAIATLAVSASI